MKHSIEMTVPEGFKAIAYRQVREGEWYLTHNGFKCTWQGPEQTTSRYFILEQERWRAKQGESYSWVTSVGDYNTYSDCSSLTDDERYCIGNYYRTEDEAYEASKRIKAIFKENLGCK